MKLPNKKKSQICHLIMSGAIKGSLCKLINSQKIAVPVSHLGSPEPLILQEQRHLS